MEKPLNEFHKKGNGVQSMCKECRKSYIREHYLKNKKKYILKAKVNDQKRLDEFREYKKTLCCVECGENRWWVLDFHHERDKEFSISHVASYGRKRVEEELKKCMVLCSNCHRDLHHKERCNSGDL